MNWLQLTAQLAAGILFGSMIFFAAVMAPLVFIKLPGEIAGRFIREVFPRYYLWGMVVGGVALLAALGVSFTDVVLLALVVAGFVYARQLLMPRINQRRDAALAGDPAAKRQFENLHRYSVIINAVQMFLLLWVFIRLA